MDQGQTSGADRSRFERRIHPYNEETEAHLIQASHHRRNRRWDREMRVLDINHPNAYAIAICKPESGYSRTHFTDRLEGFHQTAAFQQFLASMDAYVSHPRNLFTTAMRNSTADMTVSEMLSNRRNGINVRSLLRVYLSVLSRMKAITLKTPLSRLLLEDMNQEIYKWAATKTPSSLLLWDALIEIQRPFKQTADLLFLIQLLDGIARERGDPPLPVHRYELLEKTISEMDGGEKTAAVDPDSEADVATNVPEAFDDDLGPNSSQNTTLVGEEQTLRVTNSRELELDRTHIDDFTEQIIDMLTADEFEIDKELKARHVETSDDNEFDSEAELCKQKESNDFVQDEYEVESILECKKGKGGKALQYLVKWKNYNETTWEKVSNLQGCQELLDEWNRKNFTNIRPGNKKRKLKR